MTTAIQHSIGFHTLLQGPGELIEGSLWSAWWVLGGYFAGNSLCELRQAFTVQHPADEKFAKIALAVKTAFVDLLSLASSSCYWMLWAVQAKVISLGQYLPLIKNLCFGTSVVMYGTEACWDVYQISVEARAIASEGAEAKKDPHRQRLFLAQVKLAGSVAMVAWAALSMTALAGVTVYSALTTALLAVGTILGVAAVAYKYHLDTQDQARNALLNQAVHA